MVVLRVVRVGLIAQDDQRSRESGWCGDVVCRVSRSFAESEVSPMSID